ncbi:hypothetical protein [Bradyrhizobium cajani]|uniref:N-acetyltransferase domain-containing protein n=1 Tax=Bradyrhizobium cajani TaxID=1928661 RepID=A0A844TC60_9BRAD|nr:hypothetical protein [Bradyrhizobium cajani]MCP3368622.1 hypothetical protein [Bradyrhizobium cajani]MVT73584.1 hypothetical protein [Bradyrhizobium cajani]
MKSVVNILKVSRFIRIYDDLAAQKGIKLSVGFDFDKYVAITSALPTKKPTYPNFRPDRSPIEPGQGYWMIGLDKHNDVALVEAARLYDLQDSNFASNLESLRAFYADPAMHAHPQDRCRCTAPTAREITGKVAYHGDFWLRKDFRGQGMPEIMAAVLRGISFAMWSPDFVVGLAERWLLSKGVLAQYGHAHYEEGGSVLHLVEENIMDDDLLVWLTSEELQRLVYHHEKNELSASSRDPSPSAERQAI